MLKKMMSLCNCMFLFVCLLGWISNFLERAWLLIIVSVQITWPNAPLTHL